VRADALDMLTQAGWQALLNHGVRTVIDLRNDDELRPDVASRPTQVRTVRVPLDVTEDREFWSIWGTGLQFGTPLYYEPHLERFPERSVAVIREIVHAQPGGVAFHCMGGRDRAGQIAMLLLALVGVLPGEIAADYALSDARLASLYAAQGRPDPAPELAEFLAAKGTTGVALINDLVAHLDIRGRLGNAGLTGSDVATLSDRLMAK
jgi:hypothetical protein